MLTLALLLTLAILAGGGLAILVALRYDSAPAKHRLGRPQPVDDVLGRAMAFEYEDLSGTFETADLAAVA